MSPPIYTPDGSEVSEIVLPDGSTASQVIGPDGNVVFEAVPDIPDSGVFRYRFEDDSDTSTAIDDWNNNDGAITGASYSSTANEGSFGLDIGQNDSVDAGSVLQSAPFSISVWIYPSDWSSRRFNNVASWEQGSDPYGGWSFRDDGNETTPFEFSVVDGSGTSYTAVASRPPTDSWTLVTGTYGTDGTVTLYKNDSQADQVTGADGSLTAVSANTYLGNSDSFNDRGLGGVVDDARGYNKELSPTEVSNRFNTGSISG